MALIHGDAVQASAARVARGEGDLGGGILVLVLAPEVVTS